MATARRNPLAPGVYWADVFEPINTPFLQSTTIRPRQDAVMRAWLNAAGSSVQLLRREEVQIAPGGLLEIFYVFEVVGKPPAYPFRQLGFPTIQKLATAPCGVTAADRAVQADDVARKPAPGGLGDFVNQLEAELAPAVPLILLGLVLFVLVRDGGGTRNAVH